MPLADRPQIQPCHSLPRPRQKPTTLPSQDTLIGIAVIAILIFSLGLHEMAHAAAAYWRGDDTAKKLGRMTPNPIKHIDPVMTIALPVLLWFVLPALLGTPKMIFGGAKPVPVVMDKLHSRHRDMAIVAIAGPVMNFFLAFLCLVIHQAFWTWGGLKEGDALSLILLQGAFYNVLLGVFNMLPIPPLDGSRVLTFLLPPRLRPSFIALERFGLLLVIGAVFLIPGGQKELLRGISKVYDVVAMAVEWLFSFVG